MEIKWTLLRGVLLASLALAYEAYQDPTEVLCWDITKTADGCFSILVYHQ